IFYPLQILRRHDGSPDPDNDLGNVVEKVRPVVVKALAEAEGSIHLLGQGTGARPDGLDMDLVPMQLAAAADETRRKTPVCAVDLGARCPTAWSFRRGRNSLARPVARR